MESSVEEGRQPLELELESLIKNSESHATPPTDFDPSISSYKHRPPWYIYPLLIAATLAVSSAGVVFMTMPEVPPLTLSAWRLQFTSVILFVLAIPQWQKFEKASSTQVNSNHQRDSPASAIGLVLISGTSLAFHFGLWVISIQKTSLAHSLAFVCSSPIWVTMAMFILRKPVSRSEVGGAILGLCGALVLGLGVKSEKSVTLLGDMAALGASIAIVPYLMIGRRLRQWMPIFIYAAPVTATGAVLLSFAGMIIERSSLFSTGAHGVVGWIFATHYLVRILYLSFGPGLVGHTGFNALLRYLSPLTISLAINQEPLLGSLLGWAIGISPLPGLPTYIGGLLILISTVVVTVGAYYREKK